MKPPMIVLTGPTAAGKTAASIQLAKAIGGEIISADSMQVYRHMDIGSAKITPKEMEGIPHHLIDVLEPWEPFNVTVFQQMAKTALVEIYGHGHIPILTGGTGFYIQALLYDIDFTKHPGDEVIRRELEQQAKEKGPDFLHKLLCTVDAESAEEIHPNNVKRVIRAIEYYRQTGEPISAHNRREREKDSPYEVLYYVLNTDRSLLYERIDRRVDRMISSGLTEEVQALKKSGCTREMVSMQGLGYKELLDYLDGACTLQEAVCRLKQNTRHFAKRQITWFKRERDVRWLNLPDCGDNVTQIVDKIVQEANEKFGLEQCNGINGTI